MIPAMNSGGTREQLRIRYHRDFDGMVSGAVLAHNAEVLGAGGVAMVKADSGELPRVERADSKAGLVAAARAVAAAAATACMAPAWSFFGPASGGNLAPRPTFTGPVFLFSIGLCWVRFNSPVAVTSTRTFVATVGFERPG